MRVATITVTDEMPPIRRAFPIVPGAGIGAKKRIAGDRSRRSEGGAAGLKTDSIHIDLP